MDWKTKFWITLASMAVVILLLFILSLMGVDISNIRFYKGFRF